MDENEVIIVTGGSKCFMFNAQNGHKLLEYKSEEIRPRTLALVGVDFMVGICKKKPALRASILGKSRAKMQQTDYTIPGHATALAVTSCGQYCFVGIGKDLYVWKLTSGSLLAVIQQHYQDLSCIKISSDDSNVITGGKDGHVNVWMLVDLVQLGDTSERRKTRFSWTNHTNEVTDIFVTPHGSNGRVATVSLDTTCRLYELSTGALITTICLDVPLSAVTMDTLECFIFVGDVFGDLHSINLYERLPREIHGNESANRKLKIHDKKIVDLQISFDGSRLLTASEDCSVQIFLLDSFSPVVKIPKEQFDGVISNAMIVTLPLSVVMDEKHQPVNKIKTLRRNLEESRGEKVLSCTRVAKRKMPSTVMDSSILSHYIPGTFLDAVDLTKEEDDSRKKMFEGAFQKIANGPTVTEVTAVNNEMYTITCKLAMENYRLIKELRTEDAKP